MTVTSNCAHCGAPFTYEKVVRLRLFCSDECRDDSKGPPLSQGRPNIKVIPLNKLPDPFTEEELVREINHERNGAHHLKTECPFCGDGDLFIKVSGNRGRRMQMGCNKCPYQSVRTKTK